MNTKRFLAVVAAIDMQPADCNGTRKASQSAIIAII